MTFPDLTNQLIGVFIRFREERVTIMADIEAMFHLVKVVEKYRSSFRGISSPNCSNYALIKTASDNQEEYGNDAPETLKKTFR